MSYAPPTPSTDIADLRAAFANLRQALDTAWGDLGPEDRPAAVQTAFAAYRAACADAPSVAALFAQVAGVNTGALALELEAVANMFHEVALYELEASADEFKQAMGAALRVHGAAVNVAG